MREVVSNLFQGNMQDAVNASRVKTVDMIVYVGQELPLDLAHNSPIPVIHVPLRDGKDSLDKWNLAIDLISLCHSKGRVLVACRGGISRSPMLMVYWLNQKCLYNFERAFEYVKSLVAEMQPNYEILEVIR